MKEFNLVQDYFLTDQGNPADSLNSRLRLNIIHEEGVGNYSFNYSNFSLPKRFSNNQDHWGYYNEGNNDEPGISTLLPVDSANGFTTGANREPSTNGVFANMLTSVEYPTGGKTVFTYEKKRCLHHRRCPDTSGRPTDYSLCQCFKHQERRFYDSC